MKFLLPVSGLGTYGKAEKYYMLSNIRFIKIFLEMPALKG
ncbi:hypothetical protein N752_00780 [Desulforamulus aquiferis]|nr:hypothetical protein N752_00780 [Desulforamulus aquiferis]